MKRAGLGVLFLGLGAALQAGAAAAPTVVERLFARGLYPHLGARLGGVSAAVPFSLAEFGLAGGLVLLVLRLRGFLRQGRLRSWGAALGGLAGDCTLALGAGFLLFLLSWGLNYQREPFARSAGLGVRPPRPGELGALSLVLVERANMLRAGVVEDERGMMRGAGGAPSVLVRAEAGLRAAAARYPFLQGPGARPKPVLLSEPLSYLGITGMYIPFTGEPNVNTAVPDVDLPFTTSHELAHQRGFAREDEANFVAYLACRLHPDADFNYAGALAASSYVQSALAATDRAAASRVGTARSPAVRRDLDGLRAWAERHQGWMMRLSERVNDAYLKGRGQAEGILSYGRMVDLLLAERRAEASR